MRRLLESNSTTLSFPSGFHTERVKWLYDGLATSSSKNGATNQHLLYWMQTSVRSKYNYALEYAIAAANALTLPLHVVYFLSDQSIVPKGSKDPNSFGFATERHAKFGLEGLEAVQKKLHKRGLSFSVFHHSHALKLSRIEMLDKCAENAALVVTDRPYLRPWCQDLEQCVEQAKKKSHKWGLVQVEGDIVVPCESASPKEEYAARTIRPKITNQLSKYLVVLEHVEVQRKCQTADDGSKFLSSKHPGLKLLNVMDIKEVLATLQLDHSVPGVNCFIGGEKKAVEIAKHFLEKKLARYADDRNEPAGDGGSNLSLYLRYGHISPVRIALAAQKMKNCKAGRDSFLEEMIIRRELSINMAVYNGNYDNFDCLPEFAIITLRLHKEDKRPHLYTLEELEQGKTYDAYWNAAQQEVVQTGKMHGYMRMYWGKKILEWTKTPEEGFEIALYLNNKYALDAPDPNSYTGIAWTFGKHDQGWKERPIFGKVRFMNEAGLKRKFNMEGYVRKVQQLKKGHTGGGVPEVSSTSATKPKSKSSSVKNTNSAPKKQKTA